jgi:hypothetical protein
MLVACCDDPHWVSTVPRGAGHVEGLHADLAHATADHLADLVRIDAGTLDHGLERLGQQVSRMDGGQAPVAAPDRGAHGFDDDDFAFAHARSLGRNLTERSSRRGVPAGPLVVGPGMSLTEGGPQGGTGLFDAASTENTGAIIESPVALGVGPDRLAGDEMQLRFHGSQYAQGV